MKLDVWCDGSGTLIDGPACIGVALVEAGVLLCEASEYVGTGTNNLAELRAIRRGLFLAKQIGGTASLVTVFSDSEYAIGSVLKDWRPRVHVELIHALRKQARSFAALSFMHVEGHSGIYGNELADWLAGEARRRFLLTLGIERRPKKRPEPDGSHRRRRKIAEVA